MEEDNRSDLSTEDYYYNQLHLEPIFDHGEVDTAESTPSATSSTTPAIPTGTTLSSRVAGEDTDATSYTDEFECACAWWAAQAGTASWAKPEDGSVTPTPSELLYDELVHRDYVCRDSEESSSSNSRITPDTVEEEANMLPFKIRWSLGFTIRTILVNLSRGNRKEFYLATAHKGIMFNFDTNEMRFIHGHIKTVKAAGVDHTGQWLVTGGRGYHSKIIVTDTIKCKQLLILDNEPNDTGSLFLGMTPDARMFYSVHYINHPIIRVWKWTYGNDTADHVLQVSTTYIGSPCRIYFHPNDQNFIMVAFEKLLLLAHWNDSESVLEDVFTINTHKQLGTISDCVMVINKHEVYASTISGCIAIFGNVLYSENIKDHSLNTNKIFVKKIKVTKSGIKTMKCCDNIIVILEAKGTLKFFNTNILLLYWIETELPPIQMISFSLNPLKAPKQKIVLKLSPSKTMLHDDDFQEDDRVLDYEMLVKQGVPSRSSLHESPFIIRDFIAACLDGRVFHVDIVHDVFEPFFTVADSPVASLCVSTTRSIIFVAYIHGRVTAFDYESLKRLTTSTVLVRKRKRRNLVTDDDEVAIGNSFIVVSHLDVHIVVSRTNGELIFLSPTLDPLPGQRYKYTESNIDRMAFSENNQYLAYCDTGLTMNVLRYEDTNWHMYMKFRGHTNPITDLLFIHFENPQLFTISEDQHIVEYSLDEKDIAYPLKRRVKIEETAIPLCFLYYPSDGVQFFLVVNNEYKFKLIMESTLKCRSVTIGPHHGCYQSPVNKIFILPNSNGKYLIFQNKTHMGILKTPLDGNPYKHIGILANPELEAIGICNQGKYVFTYAKGEGGILVWNINTTSLDILHYMGGAGLEPYYSLIEGGSTGWFFKEIEDLFCYIQILHHEDEYTQQTFADKVYINDLPNLIRACGYYPSEVEIEQLLYEVSNKDIEKTGVLRESITFMEFVKIFLNHRPADGISMEKLEHNFKTFIDGKDKIVPIEFGKRMCRHGEAFNEESFINCMSNLMCNENVQYGEDVLEKMEPITFNYFSSKILGILQESAYTKAQERAIREASETEQQ